MSGVGSNRLGALADDVRTLHKAIRRNVNQAAEDAIEAGRCLIEAKSLLPHGAWLPWLDEHASLSQRSARLYMQLARSGVKSATIADLGLAAAARKIAGHDEEETPRQSPSRAALPPLPLPLITPPASGFVLGFLDLPRHLVTAWETVVHPGFFNVLVLDRRDDIFEFLARPVAWRGMYAVLKNMRVQIGDTDEGVLWQGDPQSLDEMVRTMGMRRSDREDTP